MSLWACSLYFENKLFFNWGPCYHIDLQRWVWTVSLSVFLFLFTFILFFVCFWFCFHFIIFHPFFGFFFSLYNSIIYKFAMGYFNRIILLVYISRSDSLFRSNPASLQLANERLEHGSVPGAQGQSWSILWLKIWVANLACTVYFLCLPFFKLSILTILFGISFDPLQQQIELLS